MKKVFAIISVLTVILSLTACGNTIANQEEISTVQNSLVESILPEATVPEATTPEATTPEATVPEATVPEATVPEATVPEATTPEATVPEATTPEATVPETTIPEVTIPQVDETPAPHVHSYAKKTEAATCTEDGKTIYTCICGDSYTEQIKALGHSWEEWKVYKEATTTAEGEQRRSCSTCKSHESKAIAKLPAKENVFFNDNNNYYDVNSVTIKPRHVYWQDGKLIAECFVINGYDHAVTNINVKSLAFHNGSVDVASGVGFGVLNGLTLPAYTHAIWTFTFSGDAVDTYGADLNSLICQSSVAFSH